MTGGGPAASQSHLTNPTSPIQLRPMSAGTRPLSLIKSSRVIFVSLLSLCATAAYLFWNQRSSSEAKMTSSEDPQPQLTVSLHQTSESTPGVIIKVTNDGNVPVTILKWESPLDPLALQLGLFILTPVEATKPLDLAVIKVSRQLPPDEASLVTIDPGESKENGVVFKESVVPVDQIKGKLAVICKGRWMSLWLGRRSELSAETIGNLGAGDPSPLGGDFESNSIEIEIA